MKILVTGGAGYIGTHTICDLISNGYEVVSIDNFANSRPEALQRVHQITGQSVTNLNVDLCNFESVLNCLREHDDIAGIIHFAAFKSAPDSLINFDAYYRNNIDSLLTLLRVCKIHSIPYFVFSSSCAVYGETTQLPVQETTPWRTPGNPYAHTKQIGEQIINFAAGNLHTRFVNLRYFNPAGAHVSNLLGEDPLQKMENIFPKLVYSSMNPSRSFPIFGTDYATRDGTCVRDYVHVMDLAAAHVKALQHLITGQSNAKVESFNVGSGNGVTVLEAIAAMQEATGNVIAVSHLPRRPGDIPAIFADTHKATAILNWSPRYSLLDICKSAYAWGEKLKGLPGRGSPQ